MKSLIKTVALSILTVSTLSGSIVLQVQASTSQLKSSSPLTNQTIYRPQSQVSKGVLVAQSVICQTRVIHGHVVSCCADSDGNVACVY